MSSWKEKFNSFATMENFAYFIMLCLPLYLIRLKIFIPTNLLEVLILIFLALFFLDKKNYEKSGFFVRKNKKYIIGFVFLSIGFLISALINENPLKGLGIIKSWVILPFVFAGVVRIIVPEEKKKNILKAYFYSAFVISLWGLVSIFGGNLSYDGRLSSVFNSPNYLAMYLAPGLITGIFLVERGFWRKVMPLSVLFVALFLTYSYLSWLAIFVTLSLVSLQASNFRLRAFLMAIMLFLSLTFFLALKTEKMQNTLSLAERSSFSSRMMIWNSARRMLSENWFLGIGPANFQEKYLANQNYYPPYLEWAVPHPHSLYLALWLGGGILSIFSFGWIILSLLSKYFSSKNKKTILAIVSIGIIFYFLLHGVADTTYFKNDLAVVFWSAFFFSI